MSTFTESLRARGEHGLVTVLGARPDLTTPPPASLRSLAARAGNRTSLERVLATLDAQALQVLEAVVALDRAVTPTGPLPVTGERVLHAVGASSAQDRAAVLAGVRTGLDLALLWTDPPRPDDAWADGLAQLPLRPAPGVADALGPYPAGLGPSLVATLARRSPQHLRRLADDIGADLGGADVAGADPVATPPDAGTATADVLVPRLAARLAAPATVDGLLASGPGGGRAVLDALLWGPPVGLAPEAATPPSPARTAVDWLLRHGLLAVSDAQHVVLPREVALALRRGRTHRHPETAPDPGGGSLEARTVAAESARRAEDLVRLVAALVGLWGAEPVPVLRAGGLGQRELRRVATRLEVPEADAALVVEVAGAAGLVADDGDDPAAFAPTADADDWLALEVPARWAVLTSAWLTSDRAAWLVGTRTDRGTLRPALDPESRRPWAPRLRRSVLEVLASATARGAGPAVTGERAEEDAGEPTVGTLAPEDVHTVLRWRTPRSVPPAHAVDAVLHEADALGVTGAGALAPAGLALLGDPPADDVGPRAADVVAPRTADVLAAAAAALDRQLPVAVEEVLLQGDLTGIVPGRPAPALAELLDAAAQVESRGAALTVRFTGTTVRRALDEGRTAEGLLADLSRHARTGVPQPLEYLVLDAARRHGRVRVGAASSYLRADDPTLLAGLAEDPGLRALGLLRLAPTVIAAQASPPALLAALRERGLAPVTEDATGQVLLTSPERHRAGGRRGRTHRPVVDAAQLGTAVPRARLERLAVDLLDTDRRQRAAEDAPGAAGTAGEDPLGAGTAAGRRPTDDASGTPDPLLALAHLREAAADGTTVWIDIVDPAGSVSRRRVRPLRVDAGRVRVVDAERETELTVAVHRIAAVTAT